MEFQILEYILLFFMDLSNFIAQVFITLCHMSFRTISKNTLLSCVILLCISVSCYSQNEKTSDNNQDLLISCDGKMLQRLNICFYRKEGEVFFAQKLFLLVSSPKKLVFIYMKQTSFPQKLFLQTKKSCAIYLRRKNLEEGMIVMRQ